MRLHRFILTLDLSADRLEVRDRETVNQVANVLRLGPGDRLLVCDGKGKEATVQLVDVGAALTVDVLDRHDVATESTVAVTLYCSVLKRENFELVVQKAVECGAARVVPVVTARTVKLGIKRDRAQKIAREAAEQSGRGIVPRVEEPMSLKEAIADAKGNDANIAFELGAPLLGSAKLGARVGVFIGPEGGWDDAEVEVLRAAGYHVAGLGPRVLRAETAAVVAVFLATSAG